MSVAPPGSVAAARDAISRPAATTSPATAPPTSSWPWPACACACLHHVATGFATDLIGEAEIGVFELRAGCRSPLVLLLCVGAIALAMPIAPERVLRAWRRAAGARSLYRCRSSYPRLLRASLPALRRAMRLPAAGLAARRSERPSAPD